MDRSTYPCTGWCISRKRKNCFREKTACKVECRQGGAGDLFVMVLYRQTAYPDTGRHHPVVLDRGQDSIGNKSFKPLAMNSTPMAAIIRPIILVIILIPVLPRREAMK